MNVARKNGDPVRNQRLLLYIALDQGRTDSKRSESLISILGTPNILLLFPFSSSFFDEQLQEKMKERTESKFRSGINFIPVESIERNRT